MQRVRDVARELNRRTVAQGEIAMQERMQQTQQREADRTAAVLRAKAEIEARISQQQCEGGAASHQALHPTFGPTGQRWDEHRRMLTQTGRARSAGGAALDVEMGAARAGRGGHVDDAGEELPAAFRSSRWRGVRGEEEQDQGRERSPRPGLPAFLRCKGR